MTQFLENKKRAERDDATADIQALGAGKGNAAYRRYAGVVPNAPVQRKDEQDKLEEVPNIDAMPNVDGDLLPGSVILPQEVKTQFYAHGGFMGAAPEMLKDPMWNKILKVLQPDVYGEVYSALQKLQGKEGNAPAAVAASGSVIPMFENNPVVSAYGMWRTKQLDQEESAKNPEAPPTSKRLDAIEAFEWDAFLPDEQVDLYNDAAPEEKLALAKGVVDQMIIAHGTMGLLGHSVLESAPLIGHSQYGSVEKTAKTNYGGSKPADWMDVFGRALKLAGAGDKFDALYGEYKQEERVRDADSKSDDMAFLDRLSFDETITEYKKMFGADRVFSVVVDVKSRSATPGLLKDITRVLNDKGVHVKGFGSFVFSELEGVSDQQQVIDGEKLDAPIAVKFLHMAAQVQQGLEKGTIKDGDHVMFNAGSLVSSDSDKQGEELAKSYRIDQKTVDQLKIVKQAHKLNIGLYVQEPDIDPKVVALLTELANTERATFNMGFAWGGMANSASGIETDGKAAKVGLGGQQKVPFIRKKWVQDNLEIQKSILAIWSRHADAPIYQTIQDQTEIEFPEAVADADLAAQWPTVIRNYSFLRNVKCSSLTLNWDSQSEDGSSADVTISLKLKMLGSGPWSVAKKLTVPMTELGGEGN